MNSVSQASNPAAAAPTTSSSSPLHPQAAAAAVSGAQSTIPHTSTRETPPSLPEQHSDQAGSPMHEAANRSVPDTASRGIAVNGMHNVSAGIMIG
jgi:hypothetical protein